MKQSELRLGQKVMVIPVHYNTDLPAPKPKEMYVRELHNPLVAGLSHQRRSKSVYGILYEVIHPLIIIRTKKDLYDYFEYAGYTSWSLASGIDSLVCMYMENEHNKGWRGLMDEALEQVWDGDIKGNAMQNVVFEIPDKTGIKLLDKFCEGNYGMSN